MAKTIRTSIEIQGTKQEAKELGQLQAEIDKTKRSLKELQKVEKQQGALTKRQSQERAKLRTQLRGVNNAYRDQEARILKNNNALRKNSGFVNGVAKGMGQWATSMIGVTAGIALLTKAVGSAFKIIKEFDQGVAQLASVLGTTKEGVAALQAEAVRLGSTTAKSATEVVKLQEAYARLGFSQSEIIDLTEATIAGSIAMNAELAEMAELTGAVVNTFDDFSTTDAPEIIDIMAAATSKSALNFSKLQTAIPNVSGAANAAGVSFTKLVALLGKLSDAGIDASSSSTALRNIFIESSSQGLNFEEILEKIANSTDKLTAANDEFGKKAAVSASIVSKNLEGIRDLDIALQDVAGTAQEMADVQLDTLNGSLILLSSAWEGFILSLDSGEGILATATRNIVDFTTAILSSASEISAADEAQQNLNKTLLGTREAAALQIRQTQDQIKASEFFLKTRENLKLSLLEQVKLGVMNQQVFFDTRDAINAEIEAAERNIEVGREYLRLVVENEKAILALTNETEESTEANAENTESIEDQTKAQEDAIKAARERMKLEQALIDAQLMFQQIMNDSFAEGEKRAADQAKAIKKRDQEIIDGLEELDKWSEETQDKEAERLQRDFDSKMEQIEKLTEEEQKHQDQINQIKEAALNEGFAIAQQASDRVFAMQEEQDYRRFQREQNINNVLYEAGAKSKEEFLLTSERLEREALKKQKERQTKQVLANTALAIISALATVQPTVPAGLLASAAAAVTGGVQLAAINSIQYADGGVFDGPSHAQGGIKGVLNGKPLEVEGDEMWIANKKAKRDQQKRWFFGTPEEMISSMNGLHGGNNWKPGGIILNSGQPSPELTTSPDLVGAINGMSFDSGFTDENLIHEQKLTRKALIAIHKQNQVSNNKRTRSYH
jgi:hypothetical protein